jgi:hypothetical protein
LQVLDPPAAAVQLRRFGAGPHPVRLASGNAIHVGCRSVVRERELERDDRAVLDQHADGVAFAPGGPHGAHGILRHESVERAGIGFPEHPWVIDDGRGRLTAVEQMAQQTVDVSPDTDVRKRVGDLGEPSEQRRQRAHARTLPPSP